MAGLRPPQGDIGVNSAPIRACLALLGVFALVVLSFALFERLGLAEALVPVAVMVAGLLVVPLAGLAAHGRRPVDYYVADRAIPPVVGGLAGAAGIAGLVVIGVAGGAFADAAEIVVTAGGFLLGIAACGLIFAPGLRRLGGFTPTDFMAARFGGDRARALSAIISFLICFLLLLAELATAGPLIATLLGLDPPSGLYVAAGLTLAAVLPGGMRSLTWAQTIQYLVIALACLVPAGFLTALSGSDAAAPAGAALLAALPTRIAGALGGAAFREIALPMLLLAAGTACLPLTLSRALAAPSGRSAGASMLWALLLGVGLSAAGLVLGSLIASQALAGGEAGLGGDPLILAAPVFAGLPAVLAGLVMAGLLAAMLATGQAALLAGASALSRDLWDRFVDPRAPEGRRLFLARVQLIAVAAVATWTAPNVASDPPALIGWALALAAGSSFVPLALGMYWRQCGSLAGLLGMAAGAAVVAVLFLLDLGLLSGTSSGGGPIQASAVAIAASFIVTVAVSLLQRREPGGEVQQLFAALRGGRASALRQRAA